MHSALSVYSGVHVLHQVLSLQVSQSGRFVATFFQHTVFVYSTERPALAPLKLYHTRVFTVSCSHLLHCVIQRSTDQESLHIQHGGVVMLKASEDILLHDNAQRKLTIQCFMQYAAQHQI